MDHGQSMMMMLVVMTGRGRETARHNTTYLVGGGVLLLRGQNTTTSLSSVQSGLSTDDGLALGVARSADLAADLGVGVPVIHCC
jgi:hypothetical protein